MAPPNTSFFVIRGSKLRIDGWEEIHPNHYTYSVDPLQNNFNYLRVPPSPNHAIAPIVRIYPADTHLLRPVTEQAPVNIPPTRLLTADAPQSTPQIINDIPCSAEANTPSKHPVQPIDTLVNDASVNNPQSRRPISSKKTPQPIRRTLSSTAAGDAQSEALGNLLTARRKKTSNSRKTLPPLKKPPPRKQPSSAQHAQHSTTEQNPEDQMITDTVKKEPAVNSKSIRAPITTQAPKVHASTRNPSHQVNANESGPPLFVAPMEVDEPSAAQAASPSNVGPSTASGKIAVRDSRNPEKIHKKPKLQTKGSSGKTTAGDNVQDERGPSNMQTVPNTAIGTGRSVHRVDAPSSQALVPSDTAASESNEQIVAGWNHTLHQLILAGASTHNSTDGIDEHKIAVLKNSLLEIVGLPARNSSVRDDAPSTIGQRNASSVTKEKARAREDIQAPAPKQRLPRNHEAPAQEAVTAEISQPTSTNQEENIPSEEHTERILSPADFKHQLRAIRHRFLNWNLLVSREELTLSRVSNDCKSLFMVFHYLSSSAAIEDRDLLTILVESKGVAGIMNFLIKETEKSLMSINQEDGHLSENLQRLKITLRCMREVTKCISFLSQFLETLHAKFIDIADVTSAAHTFCSQLAEVWKKSPMEPKRSIIDVLSHIERTFPRNNARSSAGNETSEEPYLQRRIHVYEQVRSTLTVFRAAARTCKKIVAMQKRRGQETRGNESHVEKKDSRSVDKKVRHVSRPTTARNGRRQVSDDTNAGMASRSNTDQVPGPQWRTQGSSHTTGIAPRPAPSEKARLRPAAVSILTSQQVLNLQHKANAARQANAVRQANTARQAKEHETRQFTPGSRDQQAVRHFAMGSTGVNSGTRGNQNLNRRQGNLKSILRAPNQRRPNLDRSPTKVGFMPGLVSSTETIPSKEDVKTLFDDGSNYLYTEDPLLKEAVRERASRIQRGAVYALFGFLRSELARMKLNMESPEEWKNSRPHPDTLDCGVPPSVLDQIYQLLSRNEGKDGNGGEDGKSGKEGKDEGSASRQTGPK